MNELALYFKPDVSAQALLDVAQAGPNRNEALKVLYDFERDRLTTLTKALGGFAVTVFVAALSAAIDGSATGAGVVFAWVALGIAVVCALWGGSLLISTKRLAEEYVSSLAWLEVQP